MLRKLDYELTQADIDYKRFGIGEKNSGFFLPSSYTGRKTFPPFPFDLETDISSIKTTIRDRRSSYRIGKGLKPWFKAHCKLNEGDKVEFTEIESMKKYGLKIA